MRNLTLCLVAASSILSGVPVAFAEQSSCSNKTLEGSYLGSASGFKGKAPNYTPVAYAGFDYYDGNGRTAFVSKYADGTELRVKGVYHVTKDCRAEVTFENGIKNTVFIAPSGEEFVYVIVGGPEIIATHMQRISENNLVGVKP